MQIVASMITDPRKMIEFPIVLGEMVMKFASTIMQQSFEFASSIMRLMV